MNDELRMTNQKCAHLYRTENFKQFSIQHKRRNESYGLWYCMTFLVNIRWKLKSYNTTTRNSRYASCVGLKIVWNFRFYTSVHIFDSSSLIRHSWVSPHDVWRKFNILQFHVESPCFKFLSLNFWKFDRVILRLTF
jgi:hypothetical protein